MREVRWQVGRTGKLTPLAILDPVDLAGVTVSRATLNNFGDIVRKDVKTGSKVLIRRSNEVIPEILGTVEHVEGSAEVQKPTVCPYCGSPLTEVGANIFCPNTDCTPRIVAKLTHFASKGAMDIEGFSEKTAELLHKKFGLKYASQLYGLTAEKLLELEGFKQKKAENLINSINKSRNVTLDRFVYALGIDGVGKVAAGDLSKAFADIYALRSADAAALLSLDNIGEVTAETIVNWFNDQDNLAELDRLLANITLTQKKAAEGGVFAGMFVVLTGTLPTYKRSEAQKLIEENGGVCQSSVTSKTNLVVAGEEAGSKLEKAKKLGVKIIDEDEFKTMLGLN